MRSPLEPTRRRFLAGASGAVLSGLFASLVSAAEGDVYDVCVYAGNASGVMAAVAAAREGMRVVVVEPSRWLGGMTGGGLSQIDWGRKEAVGGSALGILDKNYDDAQYRDVFRDWLKKYNIPVIFEHRVSAVLKERAKIRSITVDFAPPDRFGCPVAEPKKAGARQIEARVFIDCSYEGDLMALAKVAYTYGREAADTYGETLAGVRPSLFVYDVDPYVIPKDPRSGLLPGIQDIQMAADGAEDRQTMGYGFRWKFSEKEDHLPIEAPENYDPKTFELYRRGFLKKVNIAKGRHMRVMGTLEPEQGHIYSMGSGNLSRALWAPVVYGSNAGYPDGDWATRSRIWKEQQDFMRGITHFLRTDPAAPAGEREKALKMGFQRGVFDDTAGWPHQLYIREARRMKSDYVLTQRDLAGTLNPVDPVGLASYGVDDWPYATYVKNGMVAINGGEFSMLYLDEEHKGIYKIPYRSITPKKKECENLLVPVCVSASHVAMTSIRMEPVWMILGESAGVAAAMAVKAKTAVQDVPYRQLRVKLEELGQKLERPAVEKLE